MKLIIVIIIVDQRQMKTHTFPNPGEQKLGIPDVSSPLQMVQLEHMKADFAKPHPLTPYSLECYKDCCNH